MDSRDTHQRVALDAVNHLVLGHIGIGDAGDLLPVTPEPVGDRRCTELLQTLDERVSLARAGTSVENETATLGEAFGDALVRCLFGRGRGYCFANHSSPSRMYIGVAQPSLASRSSAKSTFGRLTL